jgi:Tfp pilus assembly protein PilF
MGEQRADLLAKRIPDGVRYVGVGVGRRWGRDFMKQAAERTGGYFTQINPDEPISWRGFELAATLNTPRLLDVQVADDVGSLRFLSSANSIAQGEEACAIARLGQGEKVLPQSIAVTGTLDGRPFRRVIPVKDVAEHADYLPRTWAQLEIDRLLAEDAVKHKDKIITLSKAMYVMTPFTSLLVLENEDMYVQYKVDRGRQDQWAMYACPAKIPIVYEPLPGMPADVRSAAKDTQPRASRVRETILVRAQPNYGKATSKAAMMSQYHSLFKEGKYRQAEMYAMRARELDPDDAVIGAMVYQARIQRKLTESAGAKRNTEELFVADLNAAEDEGPVARGKNPVAADPEPRNLALAGKADPRELGHLTKDALEHGTAINLNFNSPALRQVFEGVTARDPDLSGGGGTPDIQEQIAEVSRDHVVSGFQQPYILYGRPSFSGDDRFFFDLVAYAPGMNTSWADTEAVVEAEAAPDQHNLPARIDPAARKLIDQARAAGWQSFTLPATEGRPAHTIVFDGTGRYTSERALPAGIRERIVCDGQTLLHLYPDLAIGARRTVSRFHRAELAGLLPWFVPPVEELARGADVKLVDARTVAIIPRGADSAKGPDGKVQPYAQLHMIFAADGRLAERRLVQMPANKTLYRQLCAADGAVKLLDAEGKELAVRKGSVAAAQAPDLKADTKKLVVLPLPYRSRDHVRTVRKIENQRFEDLRFDDALALFAAEFAAAHGDEALKVFREAFHGRDQRQLGFYVLLAACGQNLDAEHADVLAEHLNEPLAQYLALYSSPVLRKHASQWAVGTGQWSEGFLHRLAVTHALYQRWQSAKADQGSARQRQAERDRALDYVRRNKGSVFSWGLLCLLQDRAGKDEAFHRSLADACPLFAEVPGLAYAARYEQARSLWKGGEREEARKQFRALYEKTLKEDLLPPIDADFRQALAGTGQEPDLWTALLRRTAEWLIDRERRPAVLALAWQCWQLDDQPLANHLLATALDGITEEKQRLPLTLAAIDFLLETAQLAQADAMLQKLLDDPKLARRAALWRLGAMIAERRDRKARALACLERALDAEYHDLPEVLNLKAVREDYGKLLEHYQALADAMVTLQIQPPADFRAKVVRAADRWRALDSDGTSACQAAARILQPLGERELVWDYLTTPVGLRPREAGPWVDLAQTLRRQGDLDLADRAFSAAFAAEPTNAQLLWDRAQNLRQAGKTVEAHKLYRRVAEGKWQPRFTWIQAQARRQVDGQE